jgi:hypothetical protein
MAVLGFFVPYFQSEGLIRDDDRDYASPNARLRNTRTHQFMHPLGQVVRALLSAGLTHDGKVAGNSVSKSP